MDNINNFIKYTAYENADLWLDITCVVPFVVEGAILAYAMFQNREGLPLLYSKFKEKFIHVIDFEALNDPKKRGREIQKIFCTTLKIVIVAAIIAGVIGTCCYFFPFPLAIPLAILTLQVGYKALKTLHSISKDHSIVLKTLIKLKNGIVDAFVPRSDETALQSALRIGKNIAITMIVLGVIGTSIYFTHQYLTTGKILSDLIIKTKDGKIDFNKAILSTIESTPFVYLIYGVLATLCLGSAIHAFMHKNYAKGVYCLANAAIAITAPIMMSQTLYGTPLYEPRLHHLSYGLLLTLLPSRASNLFGSLMTADSVGYWMCRVRGYETPDPYWEHWDYNLEWVNGHFEQVRHLEPGRMDIYDYSNVVQDHLLTVTASIAGATIMQMICSKLIKEMEEATEEVKQQKKTTAAATV